MSRSTCGIAEEELWSLVESSIFLNDTDATRTSSDHRALREHATSCAHCKERLDGLMRVRDGLQGLSAPSPAAQPEHIGAYRVLRLIGEGAMGVVYEAEQQNPSRHVAIKVMRPLRHIDEHALRAFRREVGALARLDHPAIATIYDAGQTADGQPFFAMQLAQGRSADRYVVTQNSTPRDITALMTRVARALHFAHQRGILHRDLKPAHIVIDDQGDPLVLDFGLARPLDDDAGLSMSLSGPGAIVGTLPYMSPEQVGGKPDAVDTRTDVYAMGVILYELLAGLRPYPVPTNIVEAARAIEESRPQHPAEVVSTVPRELGDVVMKALAKDPDRRYASAAAFADDLDRFQNGEAVTARPASLGYQLRVFARRHRVLVGAAALLFVVLTVGVVAVSLALVSAENEREAAERERLEAARATELLSDSLAVLDPFVGGPDATLRQAVNRIAERLNNESVFGENSLYEAKVRATIGTAYRRLKHEHVDLALPHLRTAYGIYERTLGPVSPETMHAAYDYAMALLAAKRRDEALRVVDAALAMHRRLGAPPSLGLVGILRVKANSLLHTDLAESGRLLAEAESMASGMPASIDRGVLLSWVHNQHYFVARYENRILDAYRHACREYEIRRDTSPDLPHLSTSFVNLGKVLREFGGPKHRRQMEDLAEAALAWNARWTKNGETGEPRKVSRLNLAMVLLRRGEPARVPELLQPLLETKVRGSLRRLGRSVWARMAIAHRALGNTAEVERCFAHLYKLVARFEGEDHSFASSLTNGSRIASDIIDTAAWDLRQGGLGPIVRRFLLALGAMAETSRSPKEIWYYDLEVPQDLADLARFLDLIDGEAGADAVRRRLLEIELPAIDDPSRFAKKSYIRLHLACRQAEALAELGQAEEAETRIRRELVQLERLRGQGDPLTALPLRVLGRVLGNGGEIELVEAEQRLRAALAILDASHGPDHLDHAHARRELAAFLRHRGEHAEAIELLRAARRTFAGALGLRHLECGVTDLELGTCLSALRERDQAAQCFKRAIGIADNAFGLESRLAKQARAKLDLVQMGERKGLAPAAAGRKQK